MHACIGRRVAQALSRPRGANELFPGKSGEWEVRWESLWTKGGERHGIVRMSGAWDAGSMRGVAQPAGRTRDAGVARLREGSLGERRGIGMDRGGRDPEMSRRAEGRSCQQSCSHLNLPRPPSHFFSDCKSSPTANSSARRPSSASVLFSLLHHPSGIPSSPPPLPPPYPPLFWFFQRLQELSLLQLLCWAEAPIQRFITLVSLVRGCAHARGGAMTVAIERFGRHGDAEVTA
jgi:hypothetical protein